MVDAPMAARLALGGWPAQPHTLAMSDSPPLPFDRALGRRRLARALARPEGFADFLVRRASADLADRLEAVTRPFARALDVGTPTLAAQDVLSRRDGIRDIQRLAAVPGPGASVIGDEEALPFGAATFGLVVSLLSMQSVNDLPGMLAQIRRLLVPDGLFLACLMGGETLRELRTAFAQAESETLGGSSPRVAPFADVRVLGALLQRTGFALPVVDLDRVVVRYGTPFALFADLRAMGLGNTLTDRRRAPLRRETLLRAAAIYGDRFADPDGRVRATFDLVWLSGWAPHESQQRSLKPGSATSRLADALGVSEIALAPEGERS